jgi:hypothetical protein
MYGITDNHISFTYFTRAWQAFKQNSMVFHTSVMTFISNLKVDWIFWFMGYIDFGLFTSKFSLYVPHTG